MNASSAIVTAGDGNREYIRDAMYALWSIEGSDKDGWVANCGSYNGGKNIGFTAKTRAELMDKIDKASAENKRYLSADDRVPVASAAAIAAALVPASMDAFGGDVDLSTLLKSAAAALLVGGGVAYLVGDRPGFRARPSGA
jgi:hypothetical protein